MRVLSEWERAFKTACYALTSRNLPLISLEYRLLKAILTARRLNETNIYSRPVNARLESSLRNAGRKYWRISHRGQGFLTGCAFFDRKNGVG